MAYEEYNLLPQLFAIYVSAKALGEVFEWLSLPSVLGEILAGIALGPYALVWVDPSPTVLSLAQLGAIFLLFEVGLGIRPRDLLSVGGSALGVALAGVVTPFALGFSYMLLTRHSPQESTFLGAAMVATSVGITARVLSDLQVLHTRAARIILGAAVFDDILGLLALAVVAGAASTEGVPWAHLGLISVEAVAFALLMIFLTPPAIQRFHRRLGRMSSPNAPLILALTICLGLSVIAERIGMAAIVGAFFAGLAFADHAQEWKLRAPVRGIAQFLTPFFFFLMGARLDLSALSGGVLGAASVITLLAVASKLLGCGVPLLRRGWTTALQVGVGMVPRGEVGLIIALVGLQTQALSQDSYAIVLFMVAATTILTPPFLKPLFRKPARLAASQGGQNALAEDSPTPAAYAGGRG